MAETAGLAGTDGRVAVLVFDEVIAFRVGCHGAQGVAPDLTTLGKIIGGGFAVGAVAGCISTLTTQAELDRFLDAFQRIATH